MRKTLFDLIYDNLKKINGLVGGGAVFALILWLFSPETMIPLKFFIPILIILIIVIIALFNTSYEIFNSSKKILPSILYSKKKPNGEALVCLLEPSELFSQNCLVSFYFRNEDDFEVFIGIGKVESIHENDGKIQIRLLRSDPNQEEIINGLANNDTTIKNKVQIKPNVPDEMIINQ